MARKRHAIEPGAHRATVVTKKVTSSGEKTESTAACSCGWKAEEARSSRQGALDAFDAHLKDVRG